MRMAYKFVLSLCILFILPVKTLVFAEQNSPEEFLRNPFLTLDEQKQGFFMSAREEGIYLQGIFVWPTKKIALINGQVLKEGDFIKGKRISFIYEDKVILKDSTGIMALKLPSLKESIKGE